MASIPARKGIPTTVLVRKPAHAEHMNTHHAHPQHLSDMTLDSHITASADPKARTVCRIVDNASLLGDDVLTYVPTKQINPTRTIR